MKTFFLVAVLFTSTEAFAQNAIVWEPEITVADGSVFGNLRPRASIVNGNPIVIFGKTGYDNLFIAKGNGTSFNAPISVVPPGLSSYIASWTGPDLASKGDTVVAVFKLNPTETGNVYVVRSIDGGITFSDTIKANNYAGGNAWMPSMDLDDAGNPVVSMMIHDGTWSNPRYAVTHSPDAGLTFDPIVNIAANVPGEACDCCPSEMIVSGQKEVLLFRNNDADIRDIHGVLSTDGGASFPTFSNIDNVQWSISACPSTGSDATFLGDDLYTVFSSAGEGLYRVYISKSSTTSGLNFLSRETMSPVANNGTQNYPTISSANDTIVMAWEERTNFNKDIFYSVSVPGMDPMTALTTYKFPLDLGAAGTQTNPDILYKNGFVHLFYQDDYSGDLKYRRGQIDVNLGLENHSSNTIVLSPNPSESAQVTLLNCASVEAVHSVSGEKIPFKTRATQGGIILQSEELSSGVYFIQCSTESSTSTILKWLVN